MFPELEESQGYCNLSSPSFIEWEALSAYLEAVMSKLRLTDENDSETGQGIILLKAVLKYETQVCYKFEFKILMAVHLRKPRVPSPLPKEQS